MTRLERQRLAKRNYMRRKRGTILPPPKQLVFHLRVVPPRLGREELRYRAAERYAKHRDELIAYQNEWAKANPERARRSKSLSRRQREARKRATRSGRVSYRRILERDGPLCHICGEEILEGLKGIHFDHVIPLSKGGAHVEENIKVSHAVCNMRKHTALGP